MGIYILTFIAVAIIPLALAGYGGHLATLALPTGSKKKRNALLIVWSLAAGGVLVFGLLQVKTFHSDQTREHSDATFRSDVSAKLQTIIDEPNKEKQRRDATEFQNEITGHSVKKPSEQSKVSDPIVRQEQQLNGLSNIELNEKVMAFATELRDAEKWYESDQLARIGNLNDLRGARSHAESDSFRQRKERDRYQDNFKLLAALRPIYLDNILMYERFLKKRNGVSITEDSELKHIWDISTGPSVLGRSADALVKLALGVPGLQSKPSSMQSFPQQAWEPPVPNPHP